MVIAAGDVQASAPAMGAVGNQAAAGSAPIAVVVVLGRLMVTATQRSQ